MVITLLMSKQLTFGKPKPKQKRSRKRKDPITSLFPKRKRGDAPHKFLKEVPHPIRPLRSLPDWMTRFTRFFLADPLWCWFCANGVQLTALKDVKTGVPMKGLHCDIFCCVEGSVHNMYKVGGCPAFVGISLTDETLNLSKKRKKRGKIEPEVAIEYCFDIEKLE